MDVASQRGYCIRICVCYLDVHTRCIDQGWPKTQKKVKTELVFCWATAGLHSVRKHSMSSVVLGITSHGALSSEVLSWVLLTHVPKRSSNVSPSQHSAIKIWEKQCCRVGLWLVIIVPVLSSPTISQRNGKNVWCRKIPWIVFGKYLRDLTTQNLIKPQVFTLKLKPEAQRLT